MFYAEFVVSSNQASSYPPLFLFLNGNLDDIIHISRFMSAEHNTSETAGKLFFFFSKMSSQIQLLSGFNVLFSLKSKNRLDWSVHRGSLTNPFSIWVFIQGFTLKGRTPVRKILQHANQVSSAGKWCNHLHLQMHHSLIICAHMSAVCLWTH